MQLSTCSSAVTADGRLIYNFRHVADVVVYLLSEESVCDAEDGKDRVPLGCNFVVACVV
jgi:hypothetical protein